MLVFWTASTLGWAMALQAFSFPLPETRYIRAGRIIYKFKIRAGSSFSGKETMEGNISKELEDIIRTVLGNVDSLQPFSSTHFNVFPYKKQWERASKVIFKCSERMLRAFPFTFILYVEKNTENEKQAQETQSSTKEAWQHHCIYRSQSKSCKRDSPPESAILKDLSEDVDPKNKVSTARGLNMENLQPQKELHESIKTKKFSNPQLQTRDSTVTESGGPLKVKPEKTQEVEEEQQWDEEEQQWDEEGGNTETRPENCDGSGVLTRLASHVFPFSWFFRDP